MGRRLIATEEQRIKNWKENVVKQMEGARREVTLVKRYLDAPQEDPFWESWTDEQRGQLAALQRQATELQLKIRELTLEFHDEGQGQLREV